MTSSGEATPSEKSASPVSLSSMWGPGRKQSNSPPVYLFLCRHGKTQGSDLDSDLLRIAGENVRDSDYRVKLRARALAEQPTADRDRGLSPIGLVETRDVARVLAETLSRPWAAGYDTRRIRVGLVVSASSGQATETAAILARTLGVENSGIPGPAFDAGLLDPSHFFEPNPAFDVRPELLRALAAVATKENYEWSALLVVGHQPLLSWLTSWLLATPWYRRRWTVPFSHSEVAGFLVEDIHGLSRRLKGEQRTQETSGAQRWLVNVIQRIAATPRPWHAPARLAWTVSTDRQDVADLVRNKIKSKMDTARLLGGGIAAGLTIILGLLLDPSKTAGHAVAVRAAATAFLMALILYLIAMYSYDSLLMPTRFWGERRPWRTRQADWLVHRPPSSAAWVLYQNMRRIWYGTFTIATTVALLGLVFLAYTALIPRSWHLFEPPVWLQLLMLAGAAVTTAWVGYYFRPVLGAED